MDSVSFFNFIYLRLPEQLVRVIAARCYSSNLKVRVLINSRNQHREAEMFCVTLCYKLR